MVIYVIKQGDTIYEIAQRFGLSAEDIIRDNVITEPENLVVGQSIVLLTDAINYTIVSGDTLYLISQRFGVGIKDIIQANPGLTQNTILQIGQVITIPVASQKLGSMEVNGYAFPNISEEVLEKTLPNLTYLSIFSYEVREDGSLVDINDEWLIERAKAQRVAPMMVITNIDEDGGFSGELTNQIFSSEQTQNTLINNVLNVLNEKGYYGVDVDFEYILPQDRENYNRFLEKLTAVMHENGYIVTTAVAPKISDDMEGVLYEAHDYRAHGRIADHVIIMTYEWGYTYGEPMAVAPLNQVRRVLDYATTVIPRDKILMGVPNYGYDWELPWEQGDAARAIGNVQAVDIAREKGSFIQFDELSASPYFNYYSENGSQHVVWFEDARSIDSKLRLVDEYGLGGVSYWTINRYFPQNWLVQNALYDVVKLLQ